MRRLGGAVAAWLFALLLMPDAALATSAVACRFDSIKGAYAQVVREAAKGPSPEINRLVATLARMGLAPAERLAGLSLQGQGKIEEAAVLAWRASRSGDKAGENLRRRLLKGADKERVARVRQQAAEPLAEACPLTTEMTKGADGSRQFGPMPVIYPDFDSDMVATVDAKLAQVMQEVARLAPNAGTLMLSVARLEVIPGGRYERYIGWADHGKARTLQFSASNLLDDKPVFAARGLLLAAAEEWFRHLPKASFRDPYGQMYKGIRIRGSLYPDAENQPFFKSIRQAIDMAEALPPTAKPAFKAIKEIRYNPPSEHFAKFGAPEAAVAFYRRGISRGDRRIIFIRRDIRWDSAMGLLLSLVHEGTHILQDRKAERWNILLGSGKAGKREVEMRDYVSRWYRGLERDGRRFADIAFECEALAVEIKTARALGAPVSSVASSGYLGVCPDANIALNRWKDANILGRQ